MFESRWIVVGAIALAGGMIGPILGLMEELRRAGGPQERRFIKRVAVGSTIGLLAAMGLILLIPTTLVSAEWRGAALLLPIVANAWMMSYFNRRQAALRKLEASNGEPQARQHP
jgi:hypothetical protein